MKMHADEVHTDVALVRRLIGAQFPHWADLPIERVPSSGTDNALYRLGDELVARLPRIHWAADNVERDFRWLPVLAPLLPVEIPVPIAKGVPAEGYPWQWGIYRWLEGENPAPDGDAALALDAARFVAALRQIAVPGPPASRGVSLAARDEATRAAIARCEGLVDTGAVTGAWQEAVGVPEWSGPPVWVHGDLLPGNLVLRDGRLTGVIDFNGVGVGDPACDLIVAWAVLRPDTRSVFHAELGVDEATWARGRGWALSIALLALPYYIRTNPGFAAVARHVIREVLADHAGDR